MNPYEDLPPAKRVAITEKSATGRTKSSASKSENVPTLEAVAREKVENILGTECKDDTDIATFSDPSSIPAITENSTEKTTMYKPASYRVVYEPGANVRDGLELTANRVKTLPVGTLIEVVEEKLNSEGITRVRLADGSGWTSIQTADGKEIVLELVELQPLRYDTQETLSKIGKHLVNDKKFFKASNLLMQLIDAELNASNSILFYEALCELISHPDRDITSKAFSEGYINIFESLNRKIEAFDDVLKFRLHSLSLYCHTRLKLITDDSFQFAKAMKVLKAGIVALDDDSSREDIPSSESDDSERTDIIERQKVLIAVMEVALRAHQHGWAKQPINDVVTAFSERRLLITEDLREALDSYTSFWVLQQRKESWTGPKTIRSYDSLAHPLTTKRIGLLR